MHRYKIWKNEDFHSIHLRPQKWSGPYSLGILFGRISTCSLSRYANPATRTRVHSALL